MKPVRMLLMIVVAVCAVYGGLYGALRLSGMAVHRFGWEFDAVGAGEPAAPAIHRIEVPLRQGRGWRRAVGLAIAIGFAPLTTLETAWWYHRRPLVKVDDPDYLRARGP